MPSKSMKLFALLAIVTLTMLMFSGCGKSGSKFANIEPTIRITSYEGFDDSELLAPAAIDTFLFQQKIFWHASDEDGIITGFAYRVKDQNGNPIGTPGNQFIDLNGDVTPENVIERFGPGWVLHYKPNADQSVPLDDPAANRTIWSSAKYATINFPAADENGEPLTMESTFEVIAIDNRGGITQVYDPPDPLDPKRSMAWRKFNTESARPTCSVTTTKGNPNGGQVGSGLRLDFTMRDYDPFIAETPFKFEFRMMKVDPVTEEMIPGTETEWYDSVSPQDPDMDTFLLTRYTTPALTYDIENGVTNSKTKVECRAYDLAGVVSEVNEDSAMLFAVKAGFRPQTLIYQQRVYALGDNHFIDYSDESTPEILPFTIIGGVQRFATPFFVDIAGNTTAVNSNNIKVWLRWGWHGEYGRVPATGPIIYTDNPYDKKVDTVLDGDTDENYFSEITHFDIRLDDQPYNYPPYANSHVVDSDGKEWLRIPLYSPLGQTLVLTALPSGVHSLEVRCVDLQGEVDPNPATVEFNLVDPVPAANRSGILVIDDDRPNTSYSPEPTVTNIYNDILSDYSGTKTFITRSADGVGDTNSDSRYRHFASSDLQNYELVIYHNDNPSESGNLKLENDGLTLYMRSGGNVLISHTSQLSAVLDAFVLGAQKTFIGYFGIPYISPPAKILSNSLNSLPFFQQAIGQQGYPDIDLKFGTTGQPDGSFNAIVNLRQGLSTITYFNNYGATTDVIYGMGLKPVGPPPYSPTEDQYNLYQGQPIGLRTINANNRGYILGFPLSYMKVEDARAFLNQVISEVL